MSSARLKRKLKGKKIVHRSYRQAMEERYRMKRAAMAAQALASLARLAEENRERGNDAEV